MIHWSSVRGVRFAAIEDVIFIDLPGPRGADLPVKGARKVTAEKARSRPVRATGRKPAHTRTRGSRRREQGGG